VKDYRRTLIISIGCIVLLLVGGLLFAAGYYKGYQTVTVVVDGKVIEGDVPAIIIDGRTMVPIRFVSEALGAKVTWDGSTMTASIQMNNQNPLVETPTVVRPKLDNRHTYTTDELKQTLQFDYSEKVFTVYAFANYTGFKSNNDMPFYPVREAILKDLRAINPKLTSPTFFADRGWPVDYYDYISMVMEGPPYFKAKYLPEVPPEIRSGYGLLRYIEEFKIDQLLAEFYVNANIGDLYKKYKSAHDAEISRISPLAYSELSHLFNTFNLKLTNSKIVADMAKTFLMAAGRGEVFTGFPDYSRDGATLMAYGLNENNQAKGSIFVHEVLHLYVDPILAANQDKVFAFIAKNQVGETGTGSYSLLNYVNETFIRAIENSQSKVFENHDTMAFPMSQKILDYYHEHYNPETDTLEDFLLDALDYFSR